MRIPSPLFRLPVLLLLLPGVSTASAAAQTEVTWMKVLLDGRKIGHLVSTRVATPEEVTTTERMEATIDRAGISLALVSEETSIETRQGKPLGFRARTEMSGIATQVEGRVVGDHAEVSTTSGKRVDRRTVAWPEGALLAEGVRLVEKRAGLAPGSSYEVLAFQPSNLIAVKVKAVVKGPEKTTLGLRQARLTRVDQRVELPGAPMDTSAWVDADFDLHKVVLPLLGLELVMIACTERCARGPNQSSDILDRTTVPAPRALAREELLAGLELELALAGSEESQLPSVGEQRVEKLGPGSWRVRTDPGATGDHRPPEAADSAATRWLESDTKELERMAIQAAGKHETSLARMQALEAHVRGYITNKSLRIGYASALETVRSREGDCTEHALLLAALGRALGIPTRVVTGLAYAPAFAGREHVFVPHAWTQAWMGDHWRSFDAALPGYDAGHIAFSTGDGDPAGFYAGVNLLGNVRVQRARELETPAQ